MSNRPHLGRIKSHVRREQLVVPAQAVHKAAVEAGLGRLNHQFLDPNYVALPLGVWEDFLMWSWLNDVKYIESHFDCENSAMALCAEVGRRLRVNAVGLVMDISGRHAYNALLVKDGDGVRVQVCEPQTDALVTIGEAFRGDKAFGVNEAFSGNEAYKAEEGFVLWP